MITVAAQIGGKGYEEHTLENKGLFSQSLELFLRGEEGFPAADLPRISVLHSKLDPPD
jgi:hypothetical protein